MNLIFAGTPSFASAALEALIKAGHTIQLVLTQPDRPTGRGLKLTPSAVKQIAQSYHLPIDQPPSLKAPDIQTKLAAFKTDAIIVAAYGLILPPPILTMARYGCLNIHASLLPRWRGAAPIQRALLAGDKHTGITIMQMEKGLDTGPLLKQYPVDIDTTETAQTLHDKLVLLGSAAIIETLKLLEQGQISSIPQAVEGITYAEKISKDEAKIDWTNHAEIIERAVRAYQPSPCAFSTLNGQLIKIWHAEIAATQIAAKPGQIIDVKPDYFMVACGQGALKVTALQKAGSKKMTAHQFIQGTPISTEMRLGN